MTWGSQGHGARSGNSYSCFPPFDHTPMFFVVSGDRCLILQSKIHEQKLTFLMIGMVDFQTQQVKCLCAFLAEFVSIVWEDLFWFLFFFYLEDSCFTMLCLFLLKMGISCVCICVYTHNTCTHIPPPSWAPLHPHPPTQVVAAPGWASYVT